MPLPSKSNSLVGDPDGEAETLNHIARLQLETTTTIIAYETFSAALEIARRIGTPPHEAGALEGIGHCLLRGRQREAGLQHLRDALAIYQSIQSPNARRVESTLSLEQ